MSSLTVPTEVVPAGVVLSPATPGATRRVAADETARELRRQVAELEREVQALRVDRQRDMATARGLGEALQAIRRGAMALRRENEDLRRQLSARPARKR
jgi:hypothetical protein